MGFVANNSHLDLQNNKAETESRKRIKISTILKIRIKRKTKLKLLRKTKRRILFPTNGGE